MALSDLEQTFNISHTALNFPQGTRPDEPSRTVAFRGSGEYRLEVSGNVFFNPIPNGSFQFPFTLPGLM